MSDSHDILTVVLEKDMKGEAVDRLIDAIKLLHNVLDVKANVKSITQYAAEERAKQELRDKLIEVLWPKEERRRR